jgi:hypothetical protein
MNPMLLRRGQKHRLTWARMQKVADRWIPQPRVLHPYPRVRFDYEVERGENAPHAVLWNRTYRSGPWVLPRSPACYSHRLLEMRLKAFMPEKYRSPKHACTCVHGFAACGMHGLRISPDSGILPPESLTSLWRRDPSVYNRRLRCPGRHQKTGAHVRARPRRATGIA